MTFSTIEIREESRKGMTKVHAGNGGYVTESMIDWQRQSAEDEQQKPVEDEQRRSAEFVETRRLGNFVLRKPVKVMAKHIRKVQ